MHFSWIPALKVLVFALVWPTCALTAIILQLVTTGCRKLHRMDWSIQISNHSKFTSTKCFNTLINFICRHVKSERLYLRFKAEVSVNCIRDIRLERLKVSFFLGKENCLKNCRVCFHTIATVFNLEASYSCSLLEGKFQLLTCLFNCG